MEALVSKVSKGKTLCFETVVVPVLRDRDRDNTNGNVFAVTDRTYVTTFKKCLLSAKRKKQVHTVFFLEFQLRPEPQKSPFGNENERENFKNTGENLRKLRSAK